MKLLCLFAMSNTACFCFSGLASAGKCYGGDPGAIPNPCIAGYYSCENDTDCVKYNCTVCTNFNVFSLSDSSASQSVNFQNPGYLWVEPSDAQLEENASVSD
jgi:hypothetical protein